jgi:hypothetical protein
VREEPAEDRQSTGERKNGVFLSSAQAAIKIEVAEVQNGFALSRETMQQGARG